MNQKKQNEYFQALLRKDSTYEGIFFVGVKTTSIFCRPTCSARKPKLENCEFFSTAKEALLASYRPCKKCNPLSSSSFFTEEVKKLVNAVENEPHRRWKDSDFEKLSTNATKARRQFKKAFNMTFVEYARSRRLGIAMKEIRQGKEIIQAQLSSGYESGSGFRDAFSKIMQLPPSQSKDLLLLKSNWIETLLGPMLIISDDHFLYLLEFVERRGLEKEIERLRERLHAAIFPGKTKISEQIEEELNAYFAGDFSKGFHTPLFFLGSDFQKAVWQELIRIPLGATLSYAELAKKLNKPTAFRAIGNANGANQLAIIIPCHRVITSDGKLGGYGGGIARKQWLLEHEKDGSINEDFIQYL